MFFPGQPAVRQDQCLATGNIRCAFWKIVADNADLLARGEDASFQNKVHLAMQAKGFSEPTRPGDADS